MSWAKVFPLIGIICLMSFSVFPQETKARSASYYFEKGEESLLNRSYKTALAQFNECLRIDPYYIPAYYSRAMARDHLGDKQGALTDYNIYLETQPLDKEALFSRAVARYDFGQWAMSKEDFLSLLELPPGGETNTVYFQISREDIGASKGFTTSGSLTPTYFNYLGLIETKLSDFGMALHYFDSAIHLSPTNPDLFLNRGIARQNAGDTIGAKADFELALQINPDSYMASHNLAVLSVASLNTERSEKLLTEAIEKNPNLPFSYAERGSLRMKTGNRAGALQDYSDAIRLDTAEPEYWLNRGIVKEQLTDYQGALADYQQALKLKPDYEKAWLNHGNALVKLNRVKEAIEDYTVAITYYPDYGLAYYNRSVAYHRLGKKVEACKDLTQAIAFGIKVEPGMLVKICADK
jgi:tetratricopeptide (TPR) repeat protein